MKRLFWVAVGAAVAVAGAKRLGLLDEPPAARPDAGDRTLGGAALAAQAARTAFRAGATAAGTVRSLSDARRELLAGMAEREAQLRHDLVGDVDVDALRAERRAARAAAAEEGAAGAVPPAWHRDPEAREAARAARARRGWADEPTDDPADEDGDLPYSFY
ncbi:hypothetical protein CHO01_01300 [Cellulomonas hominis]|uniref:Uncharacterized protein n=1 Tax=Cellulomonas hominis TaxID=156981 RepID=A0A511F8Y1_9CELL|nr:hypothetical protein [Cellulomonas hominis]MBB5474990.1 hypothetical protein [Cellulomonas hominis]GEL45014.1 hypothetical protein CHO01_01300 [Cellulomonas hominis]